MKLAEFNNLIEITLAELAVRDLPNSVNSEGIINQTNVTYAIASGKVSSDPNFLTVRLNISIAADYRRDNVEEKECLTYKEVISLYSLIERVTYLLHKTKIKGGSLIRLVGFENFTPESGKWRCLMNFDGDIPIINMRDELPCIPSFSLGD